MEITRNYSQARYSRTEAFACIVAGILLSLSAIMIAQTGTSIRDVRDIALPLAATIPSLEKRIALLRQEVELSESQSTMFLGSDEEKIHTYILPSAPEATRLLAIIDTLRASLESRKQLKDSSSVEVHPVTTVLVRGQTVRSLTLSFSASFHEEGLHELFSLLRLGGLLTVSDAFTEEQKQIFLSFIEATNPSDIVALEQFMRTDLASYGQNPQAYDEKFLGSVSADGFPDVFASLSSASLLVSARDILPSDLGRQLHIQNLLPIPLLAIKTLDIHPDANGWSKVTLEIETYGMEKK